MLTIRKYPRTPRLQGSRLQPGDEDLERVPFAAVAGRHAVVEEKVDGANCAISFDAAGTLRLQSRGHFLTGGARERHFGLFKKWAHTHAAAFLDVLEDRYILYGEWMYAKHTVFYDALPHYFLAFDLLDTRAGAFLDTAGRRNLLRQLPVVSVPVLFEGALRREEHLRRLLGPSAYRTARVLDLLREAAGRLNLAPAEILRQTDPSPLMEGLYIKVEEAGHVAARYKFVRADFVTRILDADTHWLSRPIVPNGLRAGVDLFAPAAGGAA